MNAITPDRPRTRPSRASLLPGIALLAASVFAPLSAQEHIHVESTKGSQVRIQPGGLVTLPIRILNTGDVRDRIALFPRLPEGWRQLTQISSASIGTGESAVRLVTVSPPKNVAAGTYQVVLSVIDSTHRHEEWLIPISVIVERLISYQVVQTQAPRFSVGGDEMSYEYDILNTGNDLLQFTVEARSAQGYPVEVNPSVLYVPVGAAGRVSVVVTSPENLGRKEKHGLILTVAPVNGGEPQSLTSLSDVLPRVASSEPDMLEFPVFGSIRFAGDNDQRGIQGEVSGFGSFTQEGSDRLEFLIRTPETQSLSVLGIRDEYRARYTTEGLKLYAGDWNYSLTTLTEVGRYAMGLGGESAVGDVTVGAFLNSTRIGSPQRKQIAGYARYDLTENVRGGINVLHRVERTNATIVSANVRTSLLRNSDLDIETGISTGTGNSGGAIAAKMSGSLPIGRYEVRFVNAGKDFASYYRDVQLVSVSLSGYATRQLRLDFLARDERRNARLDTVVGFSPRTRSFQVGGGYSNFMYVYYRASMLADPLSPSKQDKREDVLQLRMSQRISILQASAYADLGRITDRSLGASGEVRRYALNLSAQPWPRQSYSANIELSTSPDFVNNVMSERLATSFTANYRITDDTRANVSWFTSRNVRPLNQRYSILDASLDHVFPAHQRLGARVRSTSLTGASSEVAFSVELGMPIAVPLGSITTTGVLSGRLVDQNGIGLAGVYISAGTKAAVTDETGLFIMRDMRPGAHALQVDRGTLGLDKILNVPLPFEVQVIGGEESSIVLRTVSPGVVQGTTRLFNHVSTGIRDSVILVEEPVEANLSIVADITNGEEHHRRVTNSRGVFVFTDVRPGLWKATFTPIQLPEDHILEHTEVPIEVKPGQSTVVTIRVVPRLRRVRILQDGGVLRPQR